MKLSSVLLGAGVLLMVAGSACNADWLHRTYTGQFSAHNRTYAVGTDGTITVSHEETVQNGYLTYGCAPGNCGCPNNGCPNNVVPTTQEATDLTLKNEQELDDLITDLQKVQKSLQDMDAQK